MGRLGSFFYKMFGIKLAMIRVIMEVMGCQYNTEYRDLGVQLNPHQTIDYGGSDKVVAVDPTIDDQRTGDNGVIITGFGYHFGMEGNFVGTRYLELLHFRRSLFRMKRFNYGICGAIHNIGMPGRGNDGDARRFGVNLIHGFP